MACAMQHTPVGEAEANDGKRTTKTTRSGVFFCRLDSRYRLSTTGPLLKTHRRKHLHFKHITHWRPGTRNRFATATTKDGRLETMRKTP